MSEGIFTRISSELQKVDDNMVRNIEQGQFIPTLARNTMRTLGNILLSLVVVSLLLPGRGARESAERGGPGRG